MAATEGILQILNDDELDGVLAHELAHVKHRDILTSSVAATLAAAIMMVSRFAMFFGGGRDDRREGSPIALIATIILAPIAAMLIQAAISRSREFDADAGGASIAGSPNGLVNALQKIERGVARRADGRQSRDGPHVHHQAVFSRRPDGPVQHASADQRANPGPVTSGTLTPARPCAGRSRPEAQRYTAVLFRSSRAGHVEPDGSAATPQPVGA